MWTWLHKLGSPKIFYNLANRLIPWFGWGALLLILYGLYGGLIQAPADYQQGDSFRIMYVHVPAAWMSMFIYMVIAFSSADIFDLEDHCRRYYRQSKRTDRRIVHVSGA